MTSARRHKFRGFSLMEVVISVGIVGIIVPTVMALMVAGGRGSAEAANETRSVLLVRSVLNELDQARDSRGMFIEGALGWPEFPASGERYVFTADRAGALLAQVGNDEYDAGTRENGVAFLITARGERHALPNLPGARDLSKVEVTIETPPGAKAADRRKLRFVRLLHEDD